jgi:hypothetical protein
MPAYDCGRPECMTCADAFRRKPASNPVMDRDYLIEVAMHAMDNVHDMDVPFRTYAAAVIDELVREGAIELGSD